MKPRRIPFLLKAILSLMMVGIVPRTASTAETVASLPAVPWPFFVAEKSLSWVRPSPTEQQQVWNSPRFGGAQDGHQYYTQEFFLWPLGANLPYYIETWAGINDAQGMPRSPRERPAASCVPDTDPIRGAFPGAAFVGFYSLLHTVKKIEKRGEVLVVEVQSQPRGYEKVLVPWPAGMKSITLQAITPSGKRLWEQRLSIEIDGM